MKNVSILIVVNVESAIADIGNLGNYVYMVDNSDGSMSGTSGEGGHELCTACKDGEAINWSVVPVCPTNDVEIVSFTGEMVNNKVCLPQSVTEPDGDVFWQGVVEARLSPGSQPVTQQYSVVLSMSGLQGSFDPYLEIHPDE